MSHSAKRRRRSFVLALSLVAAAGAAVVDAHAQRGLLGRPSPPQPQQKQGLEYFAGTWNFTYSGRESLLTSGQRSGVVTYALSGSTLTMTLKGTVDGGGSYEETGTATWDAEKKQLHFREQIGGVTLASTGDWSSPIAISVESQPVTVKGQTVKFRRFYSILSATSFSVVEEVAIGGGAFMRVGKGDFVRAG
jgi:hypothetical protein